MKVIFALGNPGASYQYTRHNVGWLLLDHVATAHAAPLAAKPKFSAEVGSFTLRGETVLLVKPTTYYNDVGRSARALLDFYKLTPDDLLVLHDDTALDFGKIRVRHGGSHGGNNGLKSLQQHLDTPFWHIRIGTDSLLRRRMNDSDFVLSAFNSDERFIIDDWIAPTTVRLCGDFLDGTLTASSYTAASSVDG